MSKAAVFCLVSGLFLIVMSSFAVNGGLAVGFILAAIGLRAAYNREKSLQVRIGALEALVGQMRAETLRPPAGAADAAASSATAQEPPPSEAIQPAVGDVTPAPEGVAEHDVSPPLVVDDAPLIPIAAREEVAAADADAMSRTTIDAASDASGLHASASLPDSAAMIEIAHRADEPLPGDVTAEEPVVVTAAAYEVNVRPTIAAAEASAAIDAPPQALVQSEVIPPAAEPVSAAGAIEEPILPIAAAGEAVVPDVVEIPPAPVAEGVPDRERATPVSVERPIPQEREEVPPAQAARSLVDIEQLLGVNWLSKVGVAILVIGISFFLAWQLRELGPLGKDVVGTIVGITMLAAGIRAERNERYRILARAVLAGGWALLFFVSYAAHHVTAARVVESPVGALLLMLLVAGAMVVHTLRYRSQVVTALAFSLAFVTLAINRADAASLSANLVLAVGFSVVVVRMRWYGLEIIGILATYLNHYMWMRPMLGRGAEAFAELYSSAAILLLYWAIFRVSFAARRAPDEKTSVLAGMINSALLLVMMKFHEVPPERAFWPLLVLGLLELGIARLPRVRARRASFVALTTIGVALVVSAIPFRFAADQVTPVWLIDAILFTAVGIITAEPVYRRLGTLIGAATATHLLLFPVMRLVGSRYSGGAPEQEWSVGLICLAVAAALHAESLWLPRRWPAMYAHGFDRAAADLLGYVALAIAIIGGWAIFSAGGAAVFWSVLALAMTVVNRAFSADSRHLATQAAAAAALAFIRVILVDLPGEGQTVAAAPNGWRTGAVVVVAALLYAMSRLTSGATDTERRVLRIGGGWGGTALLALLISYELPRLSVAVGWIGLGIALTAVARRVDLPHLGLQANVVAAITLVQVIVVNLASGEAAVDEPLRVTWRVVTVVLLAAFVYVLSRRNEGDPLTSERWCSVLPLWVGSALLAVLPWYELRTPFVTLAWTAFVVALALIARRFHSLQFSYQANLLAAVAFLRVLIVDLHSSDAALSAPFTITWRLVATGSLVAVLYLLSHWNSSQELKDAPGFRIGALWAAATLLVLLAWAEVPRVGVVLAWTVLGFVLAALGERLRNAHLSTQANIVAGLALAKVLGADLASPALVAGAPVRLTWHAVSITALAALFYALSRWNGTVAADDAPAGRVTVPRAVATALLLLLAWHELIAPAVLAAWTIGAFVLLFIGRRWKIVDVAIHADVIALLGVVLVVTVNLPSNAIAFSGIVDVSWRMIGVPLAAALLYSLSHWNPIQAAFAQQPERWLTAARRPTVLTAERLSTLVPLAAGTGVLVLLAWYQLRVASVVLAWTFLAVILLELGARRSSPHLLAQAHIVLFTSFARLLVVNLNIDDGGAIGGRVFTVLPVALALLYAYDRSAGCTFVPKWISPAYAWCAAISLVALLRFHLSVDAVVLGWAALTVALVAFAAYSARRVFLHIGLALAAATLTRAVLHNLYERSYFPAPGAFDTWLFVGLTAVILLASLPFAFRARLTPPATSGHPLIRAARWIDARPEQVLFFIPLILITILIATDMRRGMLTVAWGIEAVLVFIFALWVRERTFRLAGIALLLLCVGKVFLLDFWSLTLRDKALTGIVMGLALIGVSLLYTRNRETILKFL